MYIERQNVVGSFMRWSDILSRITEVIPNQWPGGWGKQSIEPQRAHGCCLRARAPQVLRACDVEFETYDVLTNPGVREAVKVSSWMYA